MGGQVAARSFCGGVAQLGEHLPCKQGVKSSNLSISIGFLKEDFQKSANHCTLKTTYRKNLIQIEKRHPRSLSKKGNETKKNQVNT